MEKILNMLSMFFYGLDAISLTRNFNRTVKHYSIPTWDERRAIIGARFRKAFDKVVKNY